jgi:glycosyltransferase involved in cell wall biosynthesis
VTRLSVVVPTRDEGHRVRDTVEALLPGLPADGEVMVIDDASTDGSTHGLGILDARVRVHRTTERVGPAVARNLGAMQTSGDLLVFADAHVEPLGDWARLLAETAVGSRVGAVAPALEDWSSGEQGFGLRLVDVKTNVAWLAARGTRPYPVPLLPGFFLAMPRRVFVSVRGFDPSYAHWGMEDLDMVVRLWTLGYECLLQPAVVVRHWSKHEDPPEYQLDWLANLYNILLFGAAHYGPRRWAQLVDGYRDDPALPALVRRLAAEGRRERRAALRAVRCRDDDDLFRVCDRGEPCAS